MYVGLTIFPTEYAIQPAELAKAAEERGFESIWVAEHTHIPACRTSPWPGGAELPQEYYDTYDPFVALTAMAAVTTTVKLGTGISLVAERHPITLAKLVATLDQVSNGRFLFGVGGGWNVEEMENHGTPFKRRWKVLRESIEAMQAIWTNDQAEYHGEFVNFDPIFSNPKPVQKPYPPIHVAGVAPWNIRRAVRYGDGWIPIGVQGNPVAEIADLRKAAEEAGRDPDHFEVTIYGSPRDADSLKRMEDAGVTRAVIGLPPAPADVVLPKLDKYAPLVTAAA